MWDEFSFYKCCFSSIWIKMIVYRFLHKSSLHSWRRNELFKSVVVLLCLTRDPEIYAKEREEGKGKKRRGRGRGRIKARCICHGDNISTSGKSSLSLTGITNSAKIQPCKYLTLPGMLSVSTVNWTRVPWLLLIIGI